MTALVQSVATAKEMWARNRLTCSTDSPASLRSLAAEWWKMWTPSVAALYIQLPSGATVLWLDELGR